jgi:hypothetical protein
MARPAALALVLGLAACALPKEIDPFVIYDEVTGDIDAGRERPPGMDRPYPSLSSVPARPERPDARYRSGLTETLEADRSRSLNPLLPRTGPTPSAEAESPGTPVLPAAPPLPPNLAGAVAVPWVVPNGILGPPQGLLPAVAQKLPEPGEVPAGPTPDLLALPPPLPRIQ